MDLSIKIKTSCKMIREFNQVLDSTSFVQAKREFWGVSVGAWLQFWGPVKLYSLSEIVQLQSPLAQINTLTSNSIHKMTNDSSALLLSPSVSIFFPFLFLLLVPSVLLPSPWFVSLSFTLELICWGNQQEKMKEMKEIGNKNRGRAQGVRDGHALLSTQYRVFRG